MMETLHPFPIARSILSAAALASALEAAYPASGVRCQLIKAMILDTYRVAAADKRYILRVYPHQRRTLPEIRAELELLLYLQAHGAPVSVPVPQHSGEYVLTIPAAEGVRYAALFTYADGVPLSQKDTPANVRAYGKAIAQIHTIADSLSSTLPRTPLDLSMLLQRPLDDLERVFQDRREDWAFLRQLGERLTSSIASLPADAPFYGLCHGDVGAENVHVAANGQLMLFDFDFCGYGWRVYDVATFLIDQPQPIVQAFLEGYEEIRVLSPDEHRAIPAFQILQSIWVLGLRADYVNDWGDSYFSDRFVHNVLGFIRETQKQLDDL
jgi:Ser/Thr protein kinase RdoA (MazF antagonist)